MAKDKKSFIGYCDWERTFDFLSDEEAGKLIKHFFAYINDKDPILEDRLLQMAFEPIKLQLNRDLSKYEEVKRKRSEAGRQGGLKSGESRCKQSEPIDSDALSDEANEAFASNAKQNEANEAVTDTVIVTGTVTDTDILLEKETKGEIQEFPSSNFPETPDAKSPEDSPKEKRKKVPPKKEKDSDEELIIPEDFKPIWSDWIEYRKAKKKKPYAGTKWEQMAVNKFLENSGNDPVMGRKILNQTIENNWEGLFKLKKEYGESNNQATSSGAGNKGPVSRGKVSGRAYLASKFGSQQSATDSESGSITIDVETI